MTAKRALLISIVGFGVAACNAADNTIDPGDLELRDLLGFEPEVAASWDAEQRASARAVIRRGLADAGEPVAEQLGLGVELDERVARALATLDARLDAADLASLGVVRIRITGLALDADPVPISIAPPGPPPPVTLELAPGWERSRSGQALAARGADLLAVLATDVGHDDSALLVVPAPRLTVVAAYVEAVDPDHQAGADGRPHLLVNPVALAALEPSADEATLLAAADAARGGSVPPVQRWTRRIHDPGADSELSPPAADQVATANPYSFYGSIGECAYAEQLRCESCRPDSSCPSRTVDGDGNVECDAFAAATGRGYALFCVNQAISISGVQACVGDAAPGCAFDASAVESIDDLEDNAAFVDDVTCSAALDDCLADLYGESDGTYPPPVGEDPTPPRDTAGCGGSDDNCSADPSCNTTGPSCNNSFSCDSTCANSSSQSGCGGCSDSCASDGSGGGGGGESSGGCASCESDGGGGGGGGGDSSCGGGSDSGGGDSSCGGGSDSGGSSCGGGSDSGGSSCGGGSDGGGESSGGCGGGSDGGGESSGGCGSSGGGSSSCGSSGGGGGGSTCNVARRSRSSQPIGLLFQVLCALLPVPAAAWVRRRNRKRKQRGDQEVAS